VSVAHPYLGQKGRRGASGARSMGEGGPTAGGACPRAVGRRDCGTSTATVGRGVALKQGKNEREGALMHGAPAQYRRGLNRFKDFK
jgi:hypothetical protein